MSMLRSMSCAVEVEEPEMLISEQPLMETFLEEIETITEEAAVLVITEDGLSNHQKLQNHLNCHRKHDNLLVPLEVLD